MYSKDKTVNAVSYGYDFYVYDMGILTDIADISVVHKQNKFLMIVKRHQNTLLLE